MTVSPLVWGITIVVLVAVLLFDVVVIGRRPHVPSNKESAFFVALYAGLAVLFGLGIGAFYGSKHAGDFFGGWITEYALSVDNLFIFLIIMAKLKVPAKYQQFALMVGIVLALIFRFVFILIGAAALNAASWVFFLFGAILLYTAFHLAKDYFSDDGDDEPVDNFVTRWVNKAIPSTDEYHGTKSFVRIDGKRLMTPMFMVVVALGTTDIMFALDSIPAIFGFTQEPYLVFAATVFALMGLRQLYFLLGAMLKKLVYLSLGLSVILAFIGVKLLLHAVHATHLDARMGFEAPEISTWASLAFIVVTLLVTTVASLVRTRGQREEELQEIDDAVYDADDVEREQGPVA